MHTGDHFGQRKSTKEHKSTTANGQTQHGADAYEAGRGKAQVETESSSRTTRLREPCLFLKNIYPFSSQCLQRDKTAGVSSRSWTVTNTSKSVTQIVAC